MMEPQRKCSFSLHISAVLLFPVSPSPPPLWLSELSQNQSFLSIRFSFAMYIRAVLGLDAIFCFPVYLFFNVEESADPPITF